MPAAVVTGEQSPRPPPGPLTARMEAGNARLLRELPAHDRLSASGVVAHGLPLRRVPTDLSKA